MIFRITASVRRLLLALLLVLPYPLFGGQIHSIGYITFEVPDDWTALEQNGALILTPQADPNVLILIMQNMGSVTDLNLFLRQMMAKLNNGESVLEQGAIQALPMRQVNALTSGATTQSATGESTSRLFTAMNPGGVGSLVVYASQNPQLFQSQIPALQKVLQTMNFTNLSVTTPAPASPPNANVSRPVTVTAQAGDGGLRGLWIGTEQRMSFSPMVGQMQFSLIDHYYFLSEDGRYFKGVPVDWRHPDWATECAKHEAYACGRYSYANNKLVLRGNDGRTDELEWKFENDKVHTGSYYLFPAKAVPAGFKLEGRYTTMASVPIGYMGAQTGMAVSGSDYTFSRDGRFQTLHAGGSTFGGGSTQRVSGSYTVNGNSITMTIDGGSAETVSFFLWLHDASVIDVGGRKLNRSK